MTLINGDKIITAQLYDDECEEFTKKQMSIIDFVNAYSDEGITTADDVLDKIRAEIEELPTSRFTEAYRVRFSAENFKKKVLEILDRYKAESEEKNG